MRDIRVMHDIRGMHDMLDMREMRELRIAEAEINGYGQLYRRRIDLDAPVVVVYGPNEAGKSTLFGFIRTMLYGFPKRSAPSERREPVYGGRHGGRLFVRAADGPIVIERYADESKPVIRKLETPAAGRSQGTEDWGRLDDQAEWERQYLGGVNERLYRQLYAITLSELQEAGRLSGGELGQYLYLAGWDDGEAIAAAEKRLTAEMEVLFKPRGTQQELIEAAKEMERIQAGLRALGSDIETYNGLLQEAERTERSLDRLGWTLPEAEEKAQTLGKALSLRELWVRKRQLEEERSRLAYAERIAPGADKAWEDLSAARREAEEALSGREQRQRLLEPKLASLRFDGKLLERAAETEALLQSADRMQAVKLQLAEWETELAGLDEAIAGAVSQISPEWTERQLRELLVTVADRDYIRSVRDRQERQQRSEERLQAELEAARRQAHEAERAAAGAAEAARREEQRCRHIRESGWGLLPAAREPLNEAWRRLDEALRHWELERARADAAGTAGVPAGASGRRTALMLAGAGTAGGALVAAAAAWSGAMGEAGSAVWPWVAAAGAAAAAWTAIALRRGGQDRRGRGTAKPKRGAPAGLERREADVREALGALLVRPETAASRLLGAGGTEELRRQAEQTRAAIQAAVQAQLEALGASERAARDRADQEARWAEWVKAAKRKAEEAEESAAIRRSGELEWRSWLERRGLPGSLSPAAALEVLELGGQALEKLRQYDRLSSKAAAARRESAAYARQAEALCDGCGDVLRQAAGDPVLALRLLQAEIGRHAEAQAEHDALRRELEELRSASEAVRAKLEELERQAAQMMEAAGTGDESRYAAALEDRRKLTGLDEELAKLQIQLHAGHSAERLNRLEELWLGHDEEELRAAWQEARQEKERLEQRQRELLEQRGSLRQAMDALQEEDKRQRLLVEREMAASRLDRGTDRYAVLAVSLALIQQTKRVYEEERLPVVLRCASRYVERLTGGRYRGVIARRDRPELALETADRRQIDASLLSRGTAEQLYLAMRLALARETTRTAALPMMLDDPLVNFDGERWAASARLLADISSERQLIYFTCHEHVRDGLLSVIRDAKLVDLSPAVVPEAPPLQERR